VIADAIKVEDVVRSYDFPNDRTCYVVGQVVAIGFLPAFGNDCERYTIRPIAVVWAGEVSIPTQSELIYVAVNGTPSLLGGPTHGVVPFCAE